MKDKTKEQLTEELLELRQRIAELEASEAERKRGEEALRESQAELSAVFDNAPIVMILLDQERRVRKVNRSTIKFTGRAAKEMIGLRGGEALRCLHSLDDPKGCGFGPFCETCTVRNIVLATFETGKSYHQVEASLTFARAEELTFLVSTTLLSVSEAQMALVCIEDITKRKRAEGQLQRYAAELGQSNEELKQFAYLISHDLRAPLINMKGFAAELRSAWELTGSAMSMALPHLEKTQRQAVITALQEDVPEALDFIDSSVSRMSRFINVLFKLSRLGRRQFEPESINMAALVQSTLDSLAHQVEERSVRVTVGVLPEIVADRTAMEQIMGNILDNAVKYLEPGRPGEIEIIAENSPEETTFHIRDNGRGIAKEDIPKVFDLFRRVGKQDVPGEGMGLAYARTLIRHHGGRIWCESEPGVGTTFSFTIPRRKDEFQF